MALDLQHEKGVPVEEQVLRWRELVREPYSKLDADAFTRARVILLSGLEGEQLRFLHALARFRGELRRPLALIRRVEHAQQVLLQSLHPPDLTVLELALGHEQMALELMGEVALREPDGYVAQVHRFGLLDHVDHLYRVAAVYDRLEGKDPNTILQSYADIRPGRPTSQSHRHPYDDLRLPYDRSKASVLTKLHAYLMVAAENQTREFYVSAGLRLSDPLARQLVAEVASVEEQHVTEAESLIPPNETPLEKWLLHELSEVFAYWSCAVHERDRRVRELWEWMVRMELGHFHLVRELYERVEKREVWSLIPRELPDPLALEGHQALIQEALSREIRLRACDTGFVPAEQEPERSRRYREAMNRDGSPSEQVAGSYVWRPGTELAPRADAAAGNPESLQ